ncbi:hypothetical protein SAM23877_6126 [Streptomyces ambofaciens ATCC 23877]|uniref:Uncharacterized protein n=1 Tax=Streptomyces ambofaciens (strain ATCC 23877 / 3486 / DSM 40053 / JCM 4204 / NBRC 12836 / NRRL B-2516) TaxID=278992 RepID=A0A0K2B203_STRA7|nr:hypothetical protein SAM23877_6126 [Streptomyces ambofaciens ATCC 23877]WNA15364.1 hypothetical protein SAMYPH_33 [Streptomyces phage Samy]
MTRAVEDLPRPPPLARLRPKMQTNPYFQLFSNAHREKVKVGVSSTLWPGVWPAEDGEAGRRGGGSVL